MEGITKQDSPLQMLHEFMMDSSIDGASFVKPYDDGLLLLLPKRYGIPNPIKRHGPWRFMSMVVSCGCIGISRQKSSLSDNWREIRFPAKS